MILLRILASMFCLWKELPAIANMVIKVKYKDIPQKGDRSLGNMQELIKKAMK